MKKKSGESDEIFWIKFAYQRAVVLPESWQETYKEVVRKSLGVDEKMYKLVEELRDKKIKVGLLSNIEKRWARAVQNYGLFQPFDPCLLACDIGAEKPDPKAYQILLEKIDITANDVIFIDDRFENVEAAKKCGMDAIVFESPEQIRKELQKRGLL